ncbi:hypothetical protein B0G80_7088 [Paraburkholderia sp. BL6669N2]|nr:hypothetical protein [Paraburkholderia sp. BL6669N2]REG50641.1 hypothetical protein B0G80_7088 [Paraburkholderia sp. BL6669N2]
MPTKTLKDLFIHSLPDIYGAEKADDRVASHDYWLRYLEGTPLAQS